MGAINMVDVGDKTITIPKPSLGSIKSLRDKVDLLYL